jgi:hypothetical protein
MSGGGVGAASRSSAETAGLGLGRLAWRCCVHAFSRVHHRGQVCMLPHQLGFPLPIEVTSGVWNWEKLWKGCGAPGDPGYDS